MISARRFPKVVYCFLNPTKAVLIWVSKGLRRIYLHSLTRYRYLAAESQFISLCNALFIYFSHRVNIQQRFIQEFIGFQYNKYLSRRFVSEFIVLVNNSEVFLGNWRKSLGRNVFTCDRPFLRRKPFRVGCLLMFFHQTQLDPGIATVKYVIDLNEIDVHIQYA